MTDRIRRQRRTYSVSFESTRRRPRSSSTGPPRAFYRHIVADAQRDGHCVASHGFHHRSVVFDRDPNASEPRFGSFDRSDARRVCSCATTRPPYGHQSSQTRWAALVTRHTLVGWSASPLDWHVESASVLAARLIQIVVPGAIVLLHDGLRTAGDEAAFDRTTTLEALEAFLEHRRQEFSFVTVPELIEHGRPVFRMRRHQPPPLPDLRERSSF